MFPCAGLVGWTLFNTLPGVQCSTFLRCRVPRKSLPWPPSHSVLPAAWSAWMARILSVHSIPRYASFVHRFRVACDQLQLLPHARKRGQGVHCTHSRLGVRRSAWYPPTCTGYRPLCGLHHFYRSWSVVVGRCLPAALSGPVRIRSWLSLASILCLQEVCS